MKINGNKLREYRDSLGITRNELAQFADLSVARIWQIETDGVANVKEHNIKLMAKKLGVKPAELGV